MVMRSEMGHMANDQRTGSVQTEDWLNRGWKDFVE